MAELADIETILAKCAVGDRDAFSSLYSETSAKLYGVCLHVLGHQADAEDALQDVFVKIWHDADHSHVNGLSPMTWLITLARNLSIDKLRARALKTDGEASDVQEAQDTAAQPEAIAALDQGQIVACLAELEPDGSDAVRRAYLKGESYQELAERYDVPLKAVRAWLRGSLIKLKECLSR